MPTYEQCSEDVQRMVDLLVHRHHGELGIVELTIGLLFAHANRNDTGEVVGGPPLKRSGWPCAAKVKINGLTARAEHVPDATITIDGDAWEDWSEARRYAVLDHELQHIEILHDKETGDVLSDDLGRPKLRLRPHDFEVWGFDVIRARHGAAAIEHQLVKELADRPVQQLLKFDPDVSSNLERAAR